MMTPAKVHFMVQKKSYDSLPYSCKTTIESMVEQFSEGIDLKQLMVRVIPFETDDLAERYKEVKRVVDDFVYEIAPNHLGIGLNYAYQ